MTTGKKFAVGALVAVPLLCCGGGWFALQATFGRAASEKDHELALIRKDGVPTEPSDLAALVRVEDKDNAAPLYKKILAESGKGTEESKDLAVVTAVGGSHPRPEDVAKADIANARLQPLLALTRKAAALPGCDFHYDWSKGVNVTFSQMSELKGLAKALCFNAERKSARGDWPGALADIASTQRIGRHVGETPTVIGMLVQIAIESIANASLDRIIDAHSRDAAFVAAAKKMHDGFGPLPDFRRALIGEFIMGRIAVRDLKSISELKGTYSGDDEPRQPGPVEGAIFKSQMVHDAFDAKLIHAYRTLFEKIPKDPEKWEAGEKAEVDLQHEIDADKSLANSLNQMLFPVFSQAGEAIGTLQADRRLTDTSLRLLLERARTGAFPRFLPDYGDARIDPFSGNPLKYRREGAGFLLYSFGKDRVDDGGTPRDPNAIDKTYDEVIRIH